MAPDLDVRKQQAHQWLDRLDETQLMAVVQLIRVMLRDPLERKLANAPIDDEEETGEERQAVAEAKAWLEANGGRGIPHEEILREFGVTEKELLELPDAETD